MIGGSIFIALSLILLGLSGLCGYEAYAIIFQGSPTVSRVIADSFQRNPHFYIIGVFVAGVILGALVTHFTNWSST